ncbi:MAG TPA: SH3-like domain-containing protein [Gammaproteobacteria bacterium]|nr:SH3-like domain-containing protein [Gammaproteobacteria bacterium]
MRALKAGDVQEVLRRSKGARIDADVPVKFKLGDKVMTRNINTPGHTRLPRYARGRYGVIDRHHGVFLFPDSHAANGDKNPQNLYSVCFSAKALWGEEASESHKIYLDLWDDYLDPA